MKFTHLTFDCYGTLIDWRNGIETHLGNLLRRNGLTSTTPVYPVYVKFEAEEEGDYKSYKEIVKDTALKVGGHLGIRITEPDARRFAASIPSWRPFEDTVECLKELGRTGHKRVILSNIDRDLLKETVVQNGLDVDGFITAEDVGSYKPFLGHWNRFFDEYKVSRDATLHVAQSMYHDITPTSKLGLANAWINRYSDSKPTGINPTYVFSDLRGLVKALS